MYLPYRFNRQEFAGSLGDLGVVLPLGIAMILVNGLSPLGLFFSVGLFYLLSGVYYRIPVPVEPMKVIGAYAVATGISAPEIMASSLLIGMLLMVIALTGAMTLIDRHTPKAVVRGVQLSTGLLLMAEGVRFMIGTSTFQKIQEAAGRATYKANCITMALANFMSFLVGGMPLCHGAGGLAAHYRFGARTPGSNVIIGVIFLLLAIVFGSHILGILQLIPMAVLGILLIFAGSQLALTIMDLDARKDFFVVFTIVGITLATNLAAGFITGVIVAWMLRSEKLSV